MNDTLHSTPEVTAFVTQVRARLSDLSEDEREELVGGLEADLAERLADGEGDLGDPADYAAELRAAAGLTARRGPRVRTLGPRESLVGLLDGSRRRWDALVTKNAAATQAWDFAVVLRPAWWVLRAWLAVELLDLMAGPREYLTALPSLGNQVMGALVLLAAVVVSVLVGTGRLWPGSEARTYLPARVVLCALNLFALFLFPVVFSHMPSAWTSHEIYYSPSYPVPDRTEGLELDGRTVRNVFTYDAQGNPLTGVQLFDQKGRPLSVSRDPYLGSYRQTGTQQMTYPWRNGDQRLYNVFPLPVRQQGDPSFRVRDPYTSGRPPVLPTPPLVVVPPVSLPSDAPQPTAEPSSKPSAQSSAAPSPATPQPSASADSGKSPGR